jgi:bis(5'-nucleosyl)-tetraphosphatase (symmetrical)
MATYAIGDVQGCDVTLGRLLARCAFDPGVDRLWLVGDLVNRGPRSLAVLRRARALGDRVTVTLGNHDIHLLARRAGLAAPKRRDTLDEVLAAPDCELLCKWLAERALLHRENGTVMVHAGLKPDWTVDEAERRARAVESCLRGGGLADLLTGRRRELADDLAVFTRIRAIYPDGTLADYDGPPSGAPRGALPWFAHPERKSRDATIVFGHWSALGLHMRDGVIGLDTGAVWGRALTAVRLEDRAIYCEPNAE